MRKNPRVLRPRGPYTEWHWPDQPGGYASFEHVLTPETDPGDHSCYFWAHQFRTVHGEGGYIGLQTWGNRADGSLGKMAIFSIWDALAGRGAGPRGSGALRFDGEGTGWSCRIPWLWSAGQPYRLRVGVADRDQDATHDETTWWAAWVDGAEIGRIQVPAGWGGLGSWSVMWTEYYGQPVADCADLPYARAVFSEPTADGGTVRPQRPQSHVGEGECQTTRITEGPGGVRHEVGIPVALLRDGR